MKNPEEAIERVLTGLREAEAPNGMEARILQTVDARAADVQAEGSLVRSLRSLLLGLMDGRGLTWHLAASGAAAGLAALAIFGVATRHSGPAATYRQSRGATIASTGVAALHDPVSQRPKPRASAIVHGTAVAVRLDNAATAPGRADDQVDYEALAISEMLAPSKPAPPLPLTRQETLLAEVVHKGEPQQLEPLKPEARAKEVQIAKMEFEKFFEDPKPPTEPAKPKT